jgi:threonyl-tRNA synthetase
MSTNAQHITVILPAGEKRIVPRGTTSQELFPKAKNAIAVKANGKVLDLFRPLTEDCELEPIASSSAEGLDVLRHSAAHLMAQAVKRLFPDVQITIGPVIENGFYYDFKHDGAFTPEDLERI